MNELSIFDTLVKAFNAFVWESGITIMGIKFSFLVITLVAIGVVSSIATRFVQFRYFFKTIELLFKLKPSANGVSAWQALALATASRVGLGAVVGVSIAITTGGPGAIFWMWVIAFLGMATSFVECSLGQLYKQKDKESKDVFFGGSFFYLEQNFGKFGKYLAVIFAFVGAISCGLFLIPTQTNSVSQGLSAVFPIFENNLYNLHLFTAIPTIILAFIVIGGTKRIANVMSALLPPMALVYMGLVLLAIVINYDKAWIAFLQIFTEAFSPKSFVSGGIGAVILIGAKRASFASEAGQGTGPMAAATAEDSHPAIQGLMQSMSIFIDIFFICTATGIFLIIAGDYAIFDPITNSFKSAPAGIMLVQSAAAETTFDFAKWIVLVCTMLFGFTTMIGLAFYGETCFKYFNQNKILLNIFRFFIFVFVYWGGIAELKIVWDLADAGLGLMVWINILALFALLPLTVKMLKHFEHQIKTKPDVNDITFSLKESGLEHIKTDVWKK